MKVNLARCLPLAGVLATTLLVRGNSVVIPFATQNETNSNYPFGLLDAGLTSMRYQQVFSADAFAPFGSVGVLITEIAFETGFVFDSRQPRFQINLSTTLRPVDGLSEVFAENVGGDDAVVFGPAPLYWVNPNPGCNFCPFALLLPLAQPFYFDPAEGNLLLDVRNFQPEPFVSERSYARPFVAIGTSGDRVSRVWAPAVDATSGTVDTMGLVALFTFTPVPEPSSAILVALGLCAFAIRAFCQRSGGRDNQDRPAGVWFPAQTGSPAKTKTSFPR